MPSWTAFRTCRTCRKEARQVPVRQVLASYFANFQHLSIIPLRLPAQLLKNTDYQGIVSISGNIWETFRTCFARSASTFQYLQLSLIIFYVM